MPEGTELEIKDSEITMKANGKENSRVFKTKGISFKKTDKGLEVEATPAKRSMNARLKTIVGHLQNMAKGLQEEYEYNLTIVFSHFPMSVNVKGDVLEINNFAGEKKPRFSKILSGTTVTIKGKDVVVKGIDKETVGQTAANMESATKVKNRDRRIFQDGIFIVSKGK
mgnify:CR=1 FL=1